MGQELELALESARDEVDRWQGAAAEAASMAEEANVRAQQMKDDALARLEAAEVGLLAPGGDAHCGSRGDQCQHPSFPTTHTTMLCAW